MNPEYFEKVREKDMEGESARLLRPWDSPGKNTGVGCHFLLQCMKVKSESEVAQSCLTLSNPMDCNPPGSSIHGIFQARVLEWGAVAFSEVYLSIKEMVSPLWEGALGGETLDELCFGPISGKGRALLLTRWRLRSVQGWSTLLLGNGRLGCSRGKVGNICQGLGAETGSFLQGGVNWKNTHNLKVENNVLFSGNFGYFKLKRASQVTLRELLQGGEGRNQVIQKLYNEGQVIWASKYHC